MQRLLHFIARPRQLTWPVLFLFGVASGLLIGASSGVSTSESFAAPADRMRELRRDPISAAVLARPSVAAPFELTPAAPMQDAPASPSIEMIERESSLPKIAVVIDDLGLNSAIFDRLSRIDHPMTLSFLPYGEGAQDMVNRTANHHEAMLHLPMEPVAMQSLAGPDMLEAGSGADVIREQFASNLRKLYGYAGVNNHTGSRFTADEQSMRVLLEQLDRRGLYFLDSVTTGDAVSEGLAAENDWRVVQRDVFLDSGHPNISEQSVEAQFARAEAIARTDGHAIVIGHPYPETIAVLEEWVETVESRGFMLVTVGDLVPAPANPQQFVRLR